ncbi:hypothetical protein [Burkholderia multivorans]|uniref:hypothetical protein n=1 Tax=Burkholderia multivorans TaxID=87883 RepID=UPI0009E0C9DE|nr:hypothetical protein [Burkholderia multivorans]MDN8078322.1 hypothetical protein [Burkholderia multivorans]SAJ91462.1 hypothetical protein UA11_04709 [Burkholderia multivorans]
MSDIVEMDVDSSTVALLNKSEIDQQIATAHKYPRSIKRFRDETLQMVTLNETIAQECIYALPRDGKTIEGPSARFAEVVASAWGNSRAGARVVSDQGEFVTAQGVFHDLERNVAITYEVQRRIVDKRGNRFKPDMIGVTANAACSIALRNAILKGVPKAFWSDMYEAARRTAIGDNQTLANRRARALAVLQKYGATPDMVFKLLGIGGEEDITLEHLTVLFGITTSLKEGETTVEQAFAEQSAPAGTPVPQPQSKSARAADAPATTHADADEVIESGVPPKQAEPVQQTRSQRRAAAEEAQPQAAREPGADDEPFALDATPQGEPVSDSVLRILKTKMEQAALGEADMRKRFKFGYDGVTKANYNDVVAWIENPMGA